MSTPFLDRHIGLYTEDVQEMLATIGFSTLEEMTEAIVPASILHPDPLDLPEALGEHEALEYLKTILSANKPVRSLIGQGYYGTELPPVIQRNVLENPSWYTAYTPYQPEIAQGRLEMLMNFQTMICSLTGLPIANASMLDEGTAAAEALMLCRANKAKGDCFFISDTCFAQTIDVLRTRSQTIGMRLIIGDWKTFDPESEPGLTGALLQYPDKTGEISDYSEFVEKCHAVKALCVVAADLLALTVIKEPAAFGVDICVGTTQRFGMPMGYGGPAAAYMSCTDALKRKLPGRFVGRSIDAQGKPAYRLALQTREQHIRREKATSNICTASVLSAIIATFYAMYQGPDGLREEAMGIHALTSLFAQSVEASDSMQLVTQNYFDTLLISCTAKADELVAKALEAGYNIFRVSDDAVSISFDATSRLDDVEELCEAFGLALTEEVTIPAWDNSFDRISAICEERCFSSFHTETEMMRYMRRLESRDLALNEAMIPLGSCTMKANSATIMTPLTWPEVGGLHPFAPADQCEGMRMMIKLLEDWLSVVTGFDACSLQANSGAAGEYSALLTIHRYQVSQGQGHRNVCLIPNSAHGTNPASAAIAGWKIVPVKCDAGGNIDMEDLKVQAEAHRDDLAAIMVTYPSTHGVYEDGIDELCKIIHENGGQVFMDGANMNGQSGVTSPGFIGADVCHLNLHKSFAMPHGGGGPGVGPICCAAHLTPFLPGHVSQGDAQAHSAVSSAEFGSASLNVITWMYIAMMGAEGLRHATQLSILSANYVAKKLENCFPTLYSGHQGLVAHECILNTKPMLVKAGLNVNDIAKRLMDYGFHAPTMSFPVVDTLMVEPTESESKAELDRFIDAMVKIHAEMEAVASGAVPADDNVLVNAPHPASIITADEWAHAYKRSEAAYPAEGQRLHKFWPFCSRIDNPYGDRNFCCCCDTLACAEEADA